MPYITVFCFQKCTPLKSQWGEISNINLVREKDTGKSKGFCFICYENQKSTILAVDNFNGMQLCNRPVRVDHVEEYKVPKVVTPC